MKLYVVYQFAKEIQTDDGKAQVIGGMTAEEIVSNNMSTMQVDSLIEIAREIMVKHNFSQCTIINAIPLPLRGISQIAVPGVRL